MGEALPPISALIKNICEPARTYSFKSGREGLAHGALKLSALQICPVDHFKSYIYWFYMKTPEKWYIIRLSSSILNLNCIQTWCALGGTHARVLNFEITCQGNILRHWECPPNHSVWFWEISSINYMTKNFGQNRLWWFKTNLKSHVLLYKGQKGQLVKFFELQRPEICGNDF